MVYLCDNCATDVAAPWHLRDDHMVWDGRMWTSPGPLDYYFCGPECALEWVRDTTDVIVERVKKSATG